MFEKQCWKQGKEQVRVEEGGRRNLVVRARKALSRSSWRLVLRAIFSVSTCFTSAISPFNAIWSYNSVSIVGALDVASLGTGLSGVWNPCSEVALPPFVTLKPHPINVLLPISSASWKPILVFKGIPSFSNADVSKNPYLMSWSLDMLSLIHIWRCRRRG